VAVVKLLFRLVDYNLVAVDTASMLLTMSSVAVVKLLCRSLDYRLAAVDFKQLQ